MNRAAAILALTLLTAACTEEAAAPVEQGGNAAGEVLGGEISDAMIPLEQLQSQAPLAAPLPPSAADVDAEQPEVAGDEAGNESGGASEGAEATPAAPAPEIATEE